MLEFKEKDRYEISDLVKIMEILRTPVTGCPWDQAQTHQSIRQNFIEETYEAIEAIDLNDTKLLCEELGDVLLQVVFHSQIECEKGNFDFAEVCDGICKKLVYRHPHVFGELNAEDSAKALENWEKMKNQEKERITAADRLDSVPVSLPALMRAAKTQKRAEAFGVKPQDEQQVFSALEQDVQTVKSEPENPEQAVGHLLMSAVAAARALHVEPEQALYRATDEFSKQVKHCEEQARQKGCDLEQLSRQQLSQLWNDGSL